MMVRLTRTKLSLAVISCVAAISLILSMPAVAGVLESRYFDQPGVIVESELLDTPELPPVIHIDNENFVSRFSINTTCTVPATRSSHVLFLPEIGRCYPMITSSLPPLDDALGIGSFLALRNVLAVTDVTILGFREKPRDLQRPEFCPCDNDPPGFFEDGFEDLVSDFWGRKPHRCPAS